MTQLRGCNLAGGEVLYSNFAGRQPVSGQDYLFVSNADIDVCLASGMNCFRLLCSIEAFPNPTYQATLMSRIGYITGRAATVILDIHPGDARLAPGISGTYITPGSLTEIQFVAFWTNLAKLLKGNQLVAFGIMNEPNAVPVTSWFQTAQKVLTAIRATGATNQVWMPGAGWDGAGNWVSTNGSAWNIVDPLNRTGVQAHMYFDANSGGGATDIVNASIGATRLKNATDWCRGKGLKLFVGELALSASNTLAASTWANTVAYMDANSDVITGWCWWAYGPPAWWGNYQFTLCNNSAQMKLAFPQQVIVPPPAVDPNIQIIADLRSKVTVLSAKIASAKLALE